MDETRGFRRDIMLVLGGLGPCNGLRVKQELEEHYEEEIADAHFYQNLEPLVGEGLVNKEEHAGKGHAHRYSLTEKGWQNLEERRQGQDRLLRRSSELDLHELYG